jgi:hypothetical protein
VRAEVQDRDQREAAIFDITEIAGVQAFIAAVEGVDVNGGDELNSILSRLPRTNQAMGSGKTCVRVVKLLKSKKLLDAEFRETASRFTNQHKATYSGKSTSLDQLTS